MSNRLKIKKKEKKMSESKTLESTTAEQTPEQQTLAQVNQIVSNAVASLMDVGNLLRDIPKLVSANQQQAAKIQELESRK